jgi:WD40 repeat protein/DNA-binding SARP family transcriptional activator
MRFQVLGPLEVGADDGPVALGGPKERLLLALLLTRPNQVVSVEALIRGLWGGQPPPSAAKTVQSHVLRLRRSLEPGRARGTAGAVLVTREPGYLVRVAPAGLDSARFEELTTRARRQLSDGQAVAAAGTLREALGLWRGQAFQEFLESDLTAAEADRLAELRLVALEDRIEADLRLGRHRELVAELEGLTREHPLRERLWAQLLTALYRSGRQADALLAYQRARSILVEELGIDPGTELRRLQTAILAQDPGLELAPTPAITELPRPLATALAGPVFAGRSAELAWLRAAWKRAAHGRGEVVFLAGGHGLGKTRLAAELAREVQDEGGWVLYLRSAEAAGDPSQVLEQATQPDVPVLLVLDDLQLAAPSALEAVAALAAAATRRLLVLGAYRDTAAPPALAALVRRLDPEDGRRRRLRPLDRDDVTRLLALYLDEPAARAAADEVLEATGGMPLLVHQAAGDRAEAQAARQVHQLAGETASSRGRLHVAQTKLADDVADLWELHEHTQRVGSLAAGRDRPEGEPAEAADDRPAAAVCPYKGLARFEARDAAFFFGRERLVAELVTHLVGAGLVGVVGPSGSGKSSLVRAGLLPALADGVLPGSESWRQVLVRPGEHPMRELGPALAAEGAPGRLLVVDQFEEVFTACQDQGERGAFLAALVQAAEVSDRQLTIVVAVRADYYGHCAADPGLAGLLAANHVLVGPMDAMELRRAIELPARRAGLHLEAGLADAMIDDVAEEPGGLPLLSCALLEAWQQRRGRTLTLAAYEQTGGVRGAVARLAERAWRQLGSDEQAVARRILLRLAGPGEGEAVVRRRVPVEEFLTGEDEHAAEVMDALVDHRLLSKGHDTVEVAHEALLREWPRLRDWLEEDVQGRALHRHLIGAARAWNAADRDPGELYRGARLTGTLEWARDHRADLNQVEREFLDASRAAAEQEVADARRRAEQEAQRAGREARISRRLRATLTGLAAVLVLALVAGGLALTLRGRAERAALVADARRLGAQALLEDDLDRSLLLARQGVALDDSVETRSDLLAAMLRSPAATAVYRGDLDGIAALARSPDGTLLAVGDGDGTVAIYDTRTRKLLQEKFQGHDQVIDLEFNQDASLLAIATTGFYEPVYLWDVARAQVHQALSRGAKRQPVAGIEFSKDERSLFVLSVDDEGSGLGKGSAYLTRWDVGSGRVRTGPKLVSSHGADILIATNDGERLVIVDDTEVLVDTSTTFQLLSRIPHPGPPRVYTADLRRDDRILALWYDNGPIEFLNLKTRDRRRASGRHDGNVGSMRFSPDGRTLATGGGDQTVKLLDVASGRLRETLEGHEARVLGLQFSPDSKTLYSGGSTSVIAWDLRGSRRLGRPVALFTVPISYQFAFTSSPPDALAISQDGALLAAPLPNAPDQLGLLDLRAPHRALRPLAPGIGRISAVSISPDDSRVAVASGTAPAPVVMEVASGRIVKKMTGGHAGGVNSVRFNPRGSELATGGLDDLQAIVWDTTTGRPVRHLSHPTADEQRAVSVAWSPDGSTLATGGGKGQVILWQAASGKQVGALQADSSWVITLAYSPDGSLLAASGSGKRAVTVWDVAHHRLLGRLSQPSFASSVAFDPRDRLLAISTDKVRLWDVASLRQLGRPLPGDENGSGTNVSAFAPSGNRLITVYDSGTAFLWDVDFDHWKQQACTVAGRPLTRSEWTELLPDRPYRPACR